ncbi:hypothetical protein AB1Y20_015518 [Prymnesium parvum]|uniref:Uncharacterized protein n=1 Tax=Prymnesium parvum TaxID=97485 RepID=A0AB34K163_PRYPA
MRARRLKTALAAAQGAYEDASEAHPPQTMAEKTKQYMSVADFYASVTEGDEGEAPAREAQTPIEQLITRNRRLDERADRALQSALESRSLLHEVEGMLMRHEQAQEYERVGEEAQLDAVKAMRLERCEKLRAGLELHRTAVLSHSDRINEAAQGNTRLRRAVDAALNITEAELAAEMSSLVAQDGCAEVGRLDRAVEEQVQRVREAKLRLAQQVSKGHGNHRRGPNSSVIPDSSRRRQRDKRFSTGQEAC